MTAVDTYLERLEKVKKNGQGWKALCPCHDDHDPSLSISVNDKGDVLLNCFACDATGIDVANRLGLTAATLFVSQNGHRDIVGVEPSEKNPQPGITKGYERLHLYPDADGTVTHAQAVYRKRDGDKIVKPWTKVGDSNYVNSWKGPRMLYRLPELLASNGTRLYLEGEKDVDTAYELGLSGVTTNPFGTQSCQHKDLDLSPLYGSDLLVIVGDNDDAGRKFTATQAAHFHAQGVPVKVVNLGLEEDKADFTDWVQAGGTLDQFQALVASTAQWEPSDDVDRRPDEDLPTPINWEKAGDTSDEEWVAEPVIPKGKRTSVVANSGDGKSLVLGGISVALAIGDPVLLSPAQEPIKVLYLDYEMAEGDVLARMESYGIAYRTDLLLRKNLIYVSLPEDMLLDTEIGADKAMRLVGHHNPGLVIVDTVSSAIEGSENDNDTYKRFARLVTSKLISRGITVVMADHYGKDRKRGPRGTTAKRDTVDVEWSLTKTGAGFSLERKKGRQVWIPELAVIHLEESSDGTLRFVSPSITITAPAANLVTRLEELEVPTDWGRDKVRQVLSDHEIKATNAHLAEALRWRKRHPKTAGQVPRTGPANEDGQTPRTGPDENGGNVDTPRAGQVPRTGPDRSESHSGQTVPPYRGDRSSVTEPEEDKPEPIHVECHSCGYVLNSKSVCVNTDCNWFGATR